MKYLIFSKEHNNKKIRNKKFFFYFRMKYIISRKKLKRMEAINSFTESLFQIKETALNKKEFFKIRTIIFEIIGMLSMNDFKDNYIEGIDKISNSINQNLINNGSEEVYTKIIA